jgi:xylan 1,4-beta-xylosidase
VGIHRFETHLAGRLPLADDAQGAAQPAAGQSTAMSTDTSAHVSRVRLGPFPPAAPRDPDAAHVTRAHIDVDAAAGLGPLTRVWESFGYDEINWTYTPTGKRLLQTFAEFSKARYYVRPHYVFCSGSGFGIPHWGSGNVYHEDADGNPYYDFTIVDQAYDAIVSAGHHLIVELGFTPRDLVPPEAEELTVVPSPTAYTSYEAGTWGYPPKDYAKWGALIVAHAQHCLERYGEEEVTTWFWELWNEPDIFYWRGTPDQFCELYTVTAKAVRSVIPDAKVGGPTVTSGGLGFLKGFLNYTSNRNEPLDFISYHTKGCHFPTRDYRPASSPPAEQLSPSSTKMLYDLREFNRTIAEYEQYREIPAIVDEFDAAVPAHFGRYDNRNYEFQNTEYYPVFQLKVMKKILDLNATEIVQVERATSWSFYFEGERFFEGTRAFLTAGGIEKPLLNAYRMLSLLGDERIGATSDVAWNIGALEGADGRSMPEEVDVLASRAGNGTLAVLVWRHTDDQYQTSQHEALASITMRNLPGRRFRVRHYRIDADHSNSYTQWQRIGSSQDPTAEQLAQITARQGLEEFEPARTVVADSGHVSIDVSLPLPAASLLILEPTD